MQPGLAGYPGQYGNALIKKESLDRFIHTLRNKPVIINHKDNISDDDKVGEVLNVWYNPADGWYWCDGIIYDKTAINLIENRGWSVSSSYNFTKYNDEGGSENNVPYDIEFLDGEFDHLAIVENPRYERANIVFNSKVVNFDPNQKRDENGRWVKDDALIQQKKDKLIPIEINKDEIPQFETKEDLGNWFSGIFKDLGSVTIEDTGIRIDLYKSNAEREASKRRLQQEPNKAVAKAFEEVVAKSIKVDERQKDERHKHNQDIYYNKLKLGKDNYDVNLFVDYLEPNKEYRYAGHSTAKIDNKISTRDLQISKIIIHTKVDNNTIPHFKEELNPDMNFFEANNDKWITIHPNGKENKGKHLLVKDGETPEEAIERTYSKQDKTDSKDEKKYTWDDKEYTVGELVEKGFRPMKYTGSIYKDDCLTYLEKSDGKTLYRVPISEEEYSELENKRRQKNKPETVEDKIKKFEEKIPKNYRRDKQTRLLWLYKNNYITRSEWEKERNNINNAKEQDMALLDELKKLITKVENDKGEDMEKDKLNNEKVDKRKLIDEVGGILKDKVDDEIIRTVMKKMEEASYNDSEKSADNEKEDDDKKAENKKVKNEDKEPEKEKEKVDNLEDKIKDDVENKCKGGVDNSKTDYFSKINAIYNSSQKQREESTYISRSDRLKAGEEMFKV